MALEAFCERERDSLPLWLPVMLGSGIAAWFVLPVREAWIAFMLCCCALALLAAGLLGIGRAARAGVIAGLVAAAGCGLVWARAELVAGPTLNRPRVMTFTGKIETVELLTARASVRLLLAPDAGQGLPLHVRLNVDAEDASPALARGGQIQVRARLMPPPGASLPGAYDFARVAWFRGIGATGRALDPPELIGKAAAPDGPMGWIAGVRARLTAHIHDQLAGSPGGIAAAFVSGDQGAITEEDAQAMRTAGLAHLLSISGLHVAVVVGGTMFLMLRLLALSPTLALRFPLTIVAAGAAALAGIAYTLVAGAEVPTMRSCIAAILILFALVLGREAMTLRLVAAGALVVLLFRPEALVGPSFQMSFAAVAMLVVVHQNPLLKRSFESREEAIPARWLRKAAEILVTGLAIELALTPIALFHFHRAGLYGAIANIIAIPLTSFVIMPLEALALLFDIGGLGGVFWKLAGLALGSLIALAHIVSDWPGAVAMLPSMPVGAFGLMMIGGVWLALWRGRVHRLGAMPFLVGMVWAMVTPPPDLLVMGDGRHLALRHADGGIALLRSRAGDFVRQSFSEIAADPRVQAIDDLPTASCSADMCVADVESGGHRLRLMATRSDYLVGWRQLMAACAAVDLVVSERRLPEKCTPRWLKADRALLARTGGLAISLSPFLLRTTRPLRDDHPWVMSDAMAASAKATAFLSAAKAMRIPSFETAVTRAAIVPASGWRKSTQASSAGRALVSRNAPRAEISRSAAGEGVSPMSRHSRRLRHGVAITEPEPELLPVML